MDERILRQRMLFGEAATARLKDCHVAVFGLGGVGSWCAEALARAGVGRLTLIDRDTVSLSNINRQLCALTSTVGLGKAEVIARRIEDISPDIGVRAICGHYDAADRARFFDDYDYVADAIDLVSCKVDLIMSCRERGIPVVSALGTGNKRHAELLRIADLCDTSGDALARVVRRELRRLGVEHHTVIFSPEEPIAPEQLETPPPGRRSIPGSVVWVPATAGMLMCEHIVTELIKQTKSVSDK